MKISMKAASEFASPDFQINIFTYFLFINLIQNLTNDNITHWSE